MDIEETNIELDGQRTKISRALWEPRSLPTITTANEQPLQEYRKPRRKKRTKQCHGNRKLRCFKKKCRRRGMNEEEIQKLIDAYNQAKNKTQAIPVENNYPNQTEETKTASTKNKKEKLRKKSNKRKRIINSTTIGSIAERLPKKLKKKKDIQSNLTSIRRNYRLPKYLTKAPNLLFQNLRLLLKQKLDRKKQQRFIYFRLKLLDQQRRLEMRQTLWQSYLKLGSEHCIWPSHIYKITKTSDNGLCQSFVETCLHKLQIQYEQCTNELISQVPLYSSVFRELPSLDIMDQQLKEFVQLQQKYFERKINTRLTRYKAVIHERELYQILSNYKLTTDQNTKVQHFIQLQENQLDVYEKFLRFETRISMQYLPKNFHQLEYFIAPNLYKPLIKDSYALEFKQKHYKIIQETKRTWLNIYLHAYEIKYQEYEHQYEEDLQQFEFNNLNNNPQNERINFMESFRSYMNYRINRLKQEIFHENLPIYRRKLLRLCRRFKSKNKSQVNIFPNIILDLIHHPFTTVELAFLARGPSYIRPNQSALRPLKQREKQLDKESKTIMDTLKNFMSSFKDGRPWIPKTVAMYKLYSERLQTCLKHHYMTALSLRDQLRARRDLKLIKSIRRKLKKYKLILRQTDKSGVFHIARAIDYKRKAKEYREKTGAYEELTSNPLNENFFQVIQLLNKLRSANRIKEGQKVKMIPNRDKVELAYMYFLPKAHKKGTPLRPILNTIHAATTPISKFLDKLIRPLFDKYVRQTTIVDGVDLLDKLHKYIQKGHFNLSTLFITFDITNLYTMLPQEKSLEILAEFLHEYHCERIEGISIDTIIELGRLVLEANTFLYDKKFYRQAIGGAMGSAFTLTLANIFMWKWERETILKKLPSHELYGRYIDDIFFTSNESETTVKEWLDTANLFHPNIKLTYTIGRTTSFLDILVNNNNGILESRVYHKPSAEPAILSFLSDHPRHIFRNVIQTILMRAIRYSSSFETFNVERRIIRLTLLYNSYPSTYINTQFRQFFKKYLTPNSSLLPFINNEDDFRIIRQKLLAQPSIKQIVVSKRAATVNTCNIDCPGQENELIIKEKVNKFEKNIFIHCTHEARLHGLKRSIHEIHDDFFKNTDYQDIRLIVGHRNNPNLEFELSRKRPSSVLLKNQPTIKKMKPIDASSTA